jgi:DNA (cytosine-5)-methyltransferase 1
MQRPSALDLFSCAGGATSGLMQAGFHVVGIDIKPQPNYCGDRFIQADVLSLSPDFLQTFDFIWSSPPCQALSTMRHVHNAKPHLNLIPATRALLRAAGKPFVIENVEGARPHLHSPVRLCGSMFDLQAPSDAGLRRHRLFEASFPLAPPRPCLHRKPTIGIYGAHLRDRRRPTGTNHKSGSNLPWEHGFIAMGVPIGSMTLTELSEAIPPVYARYVAEAFLQFTKEER